MGRKKIGGRNAGVPAMVPAHPPLASPGPDGSGDSPTEGPEFTAQGLTVVRENSDYHQC